MQLGTSSALLAALAQDTDVVAFWAKDKGYLYKPPPITYKHGMPMVNLLCTGEYMTKLPQYFALTSDGGRTHITRFRHVPNNTEVLVELQLPLHGEDDFILVLQTESQRLAYMAYGRTGIFLDGTHKFNGCEGERRTG